MTDNIRPKLRNVQVTPGEQYGEPMLVLSDPLGLTERAVALPRNLVPLLELCDGTRDIGTLRAALELRTGARVGPEYLEKLFAVLDEALLLESEHFDQVYAETLASFRASQSRLPVMTGTAYQENPKWLERTFDEHMAALPPEVGGDSGVSRVQGLVCPHIDYQRGGNIYAQVWRRASEAARSADIAIVLGTNHSSGEQLVTLTRQSYATPWGVLPTSQDVVNAVAGDLGEEEVFSEELTHRHEHSVEAAAVWFHYLARDRECRLLPVLCGSFQRFIEKGMDPAQDDRTHRFAESVRAATSGLRTLVVAAGDLAHVGPAFGDSLPADSVQRTAVSAADSELMNAIARGDAAEVFRQVRDERDRRRICGLSAIYLALRILGETRGEITGYAQCQADTEGASFVSICGIVLGV